MSAVSSIALVGGTGRSGPGLALRFARAGVAVRLGSREAERGAEKAAEVTAKLDASGAFHAAVTGHDNLEAVRGAELTLLTLPYDGLAATLADLREALGGRIVVSTVVPTAWEGGEATLLAVPEGSAAEQAAALLPESRVCGAFHSLSSATLRKIGRALDEDVLVTGDDADARAAVMDLAALLPGVRPVDAGALRNARHTEALTVLLRAVNRHYGGHAGVRLTGLPDPGPAAD